MFAELASELNSEAHPEVELAPIGRAIVNRYVLERPDLVQRLQVTAAKSPTVSLANYLARGDSAGNVDVVHNTFYLPRGLGNHRDAKRVITVHDMIPELLPHTRRRLDRLTLKHRYVQAADFITCVSESTKQDLIKVYGPPSVPISVIHHGVDPRFHPDIPRVDFLPDQYLLFVGHRGQYKDAWVLFDAFAQIAHQHPDLQLLCVGGNGLSPQEIRELTRRGIRDRVSQRFLSDEEMASAYAHAEIFVFPSHFEGFGLPALEAMASGTPTVLARATSLPEVGGESALYFEPGDSRDLANVLTEVLVDDSTRIDLRTSGLSRAAQFTWRETANAMEEVYRTVIADG